MHPWFSHHPTKRSFIYRPFPVSSPYFNSQRGTANRDLFISIGFFLFFFAMGIAWFFRESDELLNPEQSNLLNICSKKQIVTDEPSTAKERNTDVSPPALEEADNLWHKFRQALQVERVHHSGDDKWKERSMVREDYRNVKKVLRDLRIQGLEGDALYATAEEHLLATYGPRVLKMLDGYRRLEEELAQEDLQAMSQEERLEYRHNARQYAFGETTAHMLFFKDEARDRYHIDERSVGEDSNLSEEVKQERIRVLRKQLRVDLASQGTTIRFPDERLQALDEKLRGKYGTSVETMSVEERNQAIWDMYSEELPPDIMEKVRQIKSSWAKRRI